jgi:hypothetical protein
MKGYFLIVACISLVSCSDSKKKINLPGKIVVSTKSDTCYVFDNNFDSAIAVFSTRANKTEYGSGLIWSNQGDNFWGVELFEAPPKGIYKGKIVRFDLSGKIIDTIYSPLDNEIPGFAYPSRNEKMLLFTSRKLADINKNPLGALTEPDDLFVMDLTQKKITGKIEKIGAVPNFSLEESPWLYDGQHFIFSIATETEVSVTGSATRSVKETPAGIYIYDVKSNQKRMLIPGGSFGICSPVGTQIAYIKNKSIWMMDIQNNTEKLVYKADSKQRIVNIHWTPDGKNIYVAFFTYYLGFQDLFTTGEKLINVRSGEEIVFNAIGHGFKSYSWK